MRILAATLLLLLAFGPSHAYRLLLDLDQDGDPSTFNTITSADTALVSLILAPDEGGEWIDQISFGLGGSCLDNWDCGWRYGTGTELYGALGGDWLFHPLFESSAADGRLCAFCCGSPGFHYLFFADSADDGFLLQENIFLCRFTAWAIEDDDPQCPLPISDLMTFPFDDQEWDIWSTILLAQDTSSVPEEIPKTATWREVKSLY